MIIFRPPWNYSKIWFLLFPSNIPLHHIPSTSLLPFPPYQILPKLLASPLPFLLIPLMECHTPLWLLNPFPHCHSIVFPLQIYHWPIPHPNSSYATITSPYNLTHTITFPHLTNHTIFSTVRPPNLHLPTFDGSKPLN